MALHSFMIFTKHGSQRSRNANPCRQTKFAKKVTKSSKHWLLESSRRMAGQEIKMADSTLNSCLSNPILSARWNVGLLQQNHPKPLTLFVAKAEVDCETAEIQATQQCSFLSSLSMLPWPLLSLLKYRIGLVGFNASCPVCFF